jgi:hypothetical protein
MSFRVVGLSPAQFRPYFGMSDAALRDIGARRVVADQPKLPCRVSMAHAEVGEELLLVNYEHQPADTPYRAKHAIYVRKLAERAFEAVDVVPEILATRLLAVRAFDVEHMMIDAEVLEGVQAAELFERYQKTPSPSRKGEGRDGGCTTLVIFVIRNRSRGNPHLNPPPVGRGRRLKSAPGGWAFCPASPCRQGVETSKISSSSSY